MKNIKYFLFNILLIFVCSVAFAENIFEFKVNRYKNIDDYDVTYFQNNEQKVKDIYRNNEFVRREGTFPDGKIKIINYYDTVVANINIKNNKFDGLCSFLEVTGNNKIKSYNINKRIDSNYKEGVLDGITTVYDEDNRVSCILPYIQGKLSGEAVYFNYENNFKKIVEFVDGAKKSEKIMEYKENEEKQQIGN